MQCDLNKAVEFYGDNWEHELAWHHENGWVIDVPHAFGMGYFYQESGKTVCKVSYVSGDMSTLFRFGLIYELDKIAFSRSYYGTDKIYDFERIKRLI